MNSKKIRKQDNEKCRDQRFNCNEKACQDILFVFYFRWDVEFVLGTKLKETNDIVPVVVEVSAYGDAGVA